MVRQRQQVKAARFILVSGKCFDSKRGKNGGREERKSQEFTFENTFHRKEQRERTLQLYTKGQET